MFDSDFEDVFLQQFPKTDINFYMHSSNSLALEPWNKTTYKIRPQSKIIKNRPVNKARNLSFNSQQRIKKLAKRRQNQQTKHQVTLSTLTFYLSVQPNLNTIQRKKSSLSALLKSRQANYSSTDKDPNSKISRQPSQQLFSNQNQCRKGLPNNLKINNLLKLKQEHQIKMKELINKKQHINKGLNFNINLNNPKSNINYIRLENRNIGNRNSDNNNGSNNRQIFFVQRSFSIQKLKSIDKHNKQHQSSPEKDIQAQTHQKAQQAHHLQSRRQIISTNNIILSQQKRINNSKDYVRKPKKAAFVGIRKVMNLSAIDRETSSSVYTNTNNKQQQDSSNTRQ